jgi:Swt1-like HEPN
MTPQISEFVFKGILATSAKRELEMAGVLRVPSMTVQETQDHDMFAALSAEVRGASIHMQRCYRLLFVFENLLREFIAGRFDEIDGAEWFDTRANSSMKTKLAERKQKEEKNQWHTGRNAHPIYYLDFGDLSLLITNHWTEFKDFLPSQSWVQSRLQDAEATRNVIAHTNVLSVEETGRLEMYLRDFIKQVG